jgi:ribonuclease HIII
MKPFVSTYIPHIGVDESGKGDYFGPLCIAAVYADASHVELLHKRGIGESKNTADKKACEDALFIAEHMPFQLMRISPKKYNELYAQFKNLNSLLAWGHASVITELYAKTGCSQVLIDQFAKEHVVINALKQNNVSVCLVQRHRGEEDIVVAAASLIARAAFLKGLTILQDHYKMVFPKGASQSVIAAGTEFVRTYGKEALHLAAKVHFKTTNMVNDS